MRSESFRILSTNYSVINQTYLIYIYLYIYIHICVCVCVCEQDLALNNLRGLICHNTQPSGQEVVL